MLRHLRQRRADRWLTKNIDRVPFDQANRMMRAYNAAGNARIALAFAERARDVAPTPELSRHMERWAKPLRAGRLIQYKTYPVTILEPVPRELAEAVEDAFEEGAE